MTIFAIQTSAPIIVKIVEPKSESLYDVLYGALGLTGILTLASIVAAVVLGGLLIWIRSRATD